MVRVPQEKAPARREGRHGGIRFRQAIRLAARSSRARAVGIVDRLDDRRDLPPLDPRFDRYDDRLRDVYDRDPSDPDRCCTASDLGQD